METLIEWIGLKKVLATDSNAKRMFGISTLNHSVNDHKFLCTPVILGLIAYYGAWDNIYAWAYFSCHSAYGLAWLLKWKCFPDKSYTFVI